MVANMFNVNDRVILKALNIPGLICDRGQVAYIKKIAGETITCGFNDKAIFNVTINNILYIFDSITNELVYKHDIRDGL